MSKFGIKHYLIVSITLIIIGLTTFVTRPIKIGLLFSLDSSAGYEESLAVQYYVKENPRIGFRKVKLLIENPPLDEDEIKNSFYLLNKKNVSAIIGCALSFEGSVVAPLAMKFSIPVLSPTTSTSLLSEKKDNFYQYLLNTYTQGKNAGKYYSSLGGDTVVLLLSEINRNYSESLADAFIEHYTKTAVKIFNNPKKMDFETIIELHPDYVIFILPSNEIIPYINSFKTYLPKTNLATTSWGYQQLLSVFSGPQVEGISVITMTDVKMIEPVLSKSIDFGEKYRLQPSFIFGFGYTTVNDLYKAIQNNGSSRQHIIDFLDSPRYVDSPYGKSFMTEYGDTITEYYYIFEITDDTLSLIKRFPVDEYTNAEE